MSNGEMNADQFLNGLDYFEEKVGPELTLTMVKTFLFIARTGSCTQESLRRSLGLTIASASRNVSYWTRLRFDKKPGMDFVEREIDDTDMRFRGLTLNANGKRFYRGFLASLPKVRKEEKAAA